VILGAVLAGVGLAVAYGASGLEDVAALVRTGEHRLALQRVRELPRGMRDSDSVRYLEGRLLLETGRPCDAMEMLEKPPKSLPEALRADALRRWAISASRCGRCDVARPVLLGVAASEVAVTRRTRAIAADCAVQLGELETAAQELERLTRPDPPRPDTVALLVLLADVYDRLGRPEDAREAARRGWIAAVQHGQGEIAAALRARANPDPGDLFLRAESFMRVRRFAEAAAQLEAIEADARKEMRASWVHAYGMALFRMRTRYAEAARVLRKAASIPSPHQVEDAFHAARALSRADQDARAVRAYRAFAKRYPRSRRAPEARFLAAWLEIRMNRPSGVAHMERLLRGRSAVRGRWRRSALWELGFRAFERRQRARAVRFLEQYTDLATSTMDQARGYYWLGRSHRRGPEAVQAYRDAIAVAPLHWYAVLAAARLSQIGVEPPPPFEPSAEDGASPVVEPLPLPDTVLAFRALGLDADAIAWLVSHENELIADQPKADRIARLAATYDSIGAYREGLRVARRRMKYLRSPPEAHPWWWNAAYPMPWRSIVDAHRGDLPRALIYATMRQESGYQPEVVSRAGAVGLMQVMPHVAGRVAGHPVTARMLRSPEHNLPIGIAEMRSLAAEFDDVYPLSIAAYNAGKRRVQRWLRESRKIELDRFVERIPFNETRNYVRRVSTHYARYRYLDDSDRSWPTMPRFVSP